MSTAEAHWHYNKRYVGRHEGAGRHRVPEWKEATKKFTVVAVVIFIAIMVVLASTGAPGKEAPSRANNIWAADENMELPAWEERHAEPNVAQDTPVGFLPPTQAPPPPPLRVQMIWTPPTPLPVPSSTLPSLTPATQPSVLPTTGPPESTPTPEPSPSSTPDPSPCPSPTLDPGSSPTPSTTPSASLSPSTGPSPTQTPTTTPGPTASPTTGATPTPEPTPNPTPSPSPTLAPSPTPPGWGKRPPSSLTPGPSETS